MTNEGIFYAQGEFDHFEIYFKSVDTGELRDVGTIDAALYPFMDVTADGRSLLVTQIDRQGSDLMIVEDFQLRQRVHDGRIQTQWRPQRDSNPRCRRERAVS